MWKRFLVIIIALVGTFSVVYLNDSKLSAENTTSIINGNSMINNIVWVKPGYKFYLGRYSGSEILWGAEQLNGNTVWALGNASKQLYWNSWYGTEVSSVYSDLRYNQEPCVSIIPPIILSINENLNDREKNIVMPQSSFSFFGEPYIFTPTYDDIGNPIEGKTGKMNLGLEYLKNSNGLSWGLAQTNNTDVAFAGGAYEVAFRVVNADGTIPLVYQHNKVALRPALQLNIDNIAFALPHDVNGTSFSQLALASMVNAAEAANDGQLTNILQIRSLSKSMSVVFDGIYNKKDEQINVISKGEKIKVKAQASEGANQYVSILFFDSSGLTPLYYRVLGSAKENGLYELDLTGLPTGEYTVAIVNEVIDSSIKGVLSSSSFSKTMTLKVVSPVSVKFNSNFANLKYEDSKTLPDAIIGNFNIKDGVSAYTRELKPTITDSESYHNFKISDIANADGSYNIIVTNKLKVGTYKFLIEVTDSNGVSATTEVKVDVNKTKPTLSFTDKKQVDIMIGQSADTSGSISFSNTDTSFTPKLVFTSDKGDSGLLTVAIDAKDMTKYVVTPASTYNGNSLPVSYTLTLSGVETENFLAPDSVTKTYYLYKELSALEWNATSSSINVDDVSTSGYTVGTLLAKDGYPDYTYELVSASDSDYNATTGKDNSSFVLDVEKASYGTKVKVKTAGKLSAKTYYLQFRVTDKKGATKLQTGSFSVVANAQSALSFYDKAGGTKITSMNVTYGDATKSLLAEGGSTDKAIIYEFAPANQQPIDLVGSPSDYAEIDSNKGTITPKKVGTIKVMATRPANDTYSAISVTMDLTILAGGQSISFQKSVPEKKAFKENESIDIPANLTRDDESTGSITYSSLTPNVCSIEDESVAKVTMLTKGECRVKAANEDDNYEKAEIQTTINLYEGMKGVFTAKANVKQGDASTKAHDTTGLANITLSKGDGIYDFVSLNVKKNTVAQSGMFEISGNKTNWKILPKQDISYGTYDITLIMKDGEGDETTITGTITIGLQENENFMLTFENEKATKITKDFQSVKTNGIQLSTQNKLGTGTIFYAPADSNTKDPGETSDALEIDPVTGNISVHRVTTDKDSYQFYAYIEEDTSYGYARQETQKVTVTITASSQSMSFTDEKGEIITSIEETYAAAPKNTFQLYTKRLGSGTITYKLKDTSSKSIIEVSETGLVTILKATDIKNPEEVILVASVAAKDGYEENEIEIPVTIKQAEQRIEWTTKEDSFVHFDEEIGNVETKETAILTRKDESKGAVTYEAIQTDICTIDGEGNIVGKQVGTCTIKAKNTDTNYAKAEISKSITFYKGLTGKFTPAQTLLEANNSQAGAVAGSVEVIEGSTEDSEFSYAIAEGESDLFTILEPSYGTISLAKNLMVEDLQGISYNKTKGGYPLKIKVNIVDASTKASTTVECEILVQGAEQQDVSFNDGAGNKTLKISKTYAQNGTFSLGLIDNLGGTATYTLAKDSPNDVIKITGNVVSILNANAEEDARPVIVLAEISAKNGYASKKIECEIEITKAEQSKFKFKKDTITMLPEISATPELTGGVPMDVDKQEGMITLSSKNPDIVSIDEKDSTMIHSLTEGKATIIAIITGNRNYKDGKAEATVTVTTKSAYPFLISVPSATYGDIQEKKASILQGSIPPSVDGVIKRTWTSSNSEVATIDEEGVITIKNAGETTIKCVQESTKDDTVVDSITFTVKQKPLLVTIDDQSIAVKESLPDFTYTIEEGAIIDSDKDSFLDPEFICTDDAGEVILDTLTAGNYTIQGIYDTTILPYKNYKITIDTGILEISQKASSKNWITLIGHESQKVLNAKEWQKEAVRITLEESQSSPYDEISIDKQVWEQESILYDKEGNHETEVYFRNHVNQAEATPQTTAIKIDQTAPSIEAINGVPIEQSVVEKILHTVSFGAWAKPNDKISIHAKDNKKDSVNEISGLAELHYRVYELDEHNVRSETAYIDKVIPMIAETSYFTIEQIGTYRICATVKDKAGNESKESCADLHVKKLDVDVDGDKKPDFNDPDGNGCADFNIVYKDEEGNWITLNEDKDRDGIPERNIDSDGDGEPDINVDTDHDGMPDRNLVIMTKELWKPTMCVSQHGEQYASGIDITPQINVDTDHNGIPDINIDTSGDMKADINVSKDGIHPYLNIAIVHTPWLPETNYTYQKFDYDTQIDFKRYLNIDTNNDGLPDVNIDLDGDGIADLNIDTTGNEIPNVDIDGDGDGKSDVNLDTNGDGIPDKDVMEITEWNPTHTVEGEIVYGTSFIDRLDYLEHHGIQVAKQKDRFLPNYAIRVSDVTNEKQEEITGIIQKEGRKIAAIYEVDLLQDGIKVQPDGKLIIRIPVLEGLVNPSLLIQTADGNYQAVNAEIKEGYYVIESDYLGIISILNEEIPSTVDQPAIIEDKNTGGAVQQNVKTSVAGSFTGDETTYGSYILGSGVSFLCLLFLYKRKKA